MGNIAKELSLNKHPKDCKDLSLVNARNVMVSNDFSCLQNEFSITAHPGITEILKDSDGTQIRVIVGYIPCNTEVVLFVCDKETLDKAFDFNDTSVDFPIDCEIIRYDENQSCGTVVRNFKYHGGRLTGTFTYNIKHNLIIAVGEYGTWNDVDVPLRTINLGGGDGFINIYDDTNLDPGLHALSPELILPKITDFNYIPGTTYKGWYHFFIRYKINKVDYTHWFPIGYPIFVCDTEKQSIFKYGYKDFGASTYAITGAIDYFSSKSNIANETISMDLTNFDERYDYYQIGFICVAKDSSKAFRSNDIDINNFNFILSIAEVNDYTVEELILDHFNYYNVANVINYQNRLYISNFKEFGDSIVSNIDLNKIKLTFEKEEISIDDYAYQTITIEDDSNVATLDNVVSSEQKNIEINTDYDVIEKNPYFQGGTVIPYLKIGDMIGVATLITANTETGNIITKEGNQVPTTVVFEKDNHNVVKRIIFTATVAGKEYKAMYRYSPTSYVSTFTYIIYYNDFTEDIICNAADIQSGSPVFIDTNNSFNKRKKESTLIPGEIYSFYIHFVNKYGEATNGYKIPNKIGKDNITTVNIITESAVTTFPINQKVFAEDGTIYRSGNETISKISPVSDDDVYTEILGKYGFLINIPNIKWYQIDDVYIVNPNNCFIPFINDNGDILYKVPFNDFVFNGSTVTSILYKLKFDLDTFQLPYNCVGYYFSYEKFEPTVKYRGLLTKKDISGQTEVIAANDNEVDYNNYNKSNKDNLDVVHFYSSNLDIDDSLELDFNVLQVVKKTALYESLAAYTSQSKVEYANARFPANLNKPEYGGSFVNKLIGLDKYSISIAGDALKDKKNLGTSIEIKNTDFVKSLFVGDYIFKANLVKLTTNIYTNENKILIRFTDVYYTERQGVINRGLNGHITYNDFIVYDFNKFVFNSQNNTVLNEKYGLYYKTDVFNVKDENDQDIYVAKYISSIRAPLYYAQIFTYDVIFNEAKSFKNEPSIYYLQLEQTIDDEKVANQMKQFAQNIIVLPENTVDLFENKYTSQDSLNPKTFTSHSDNDDYMVNYNKRIRRSNVIADESNENSWRVFPLEGYKDITENKGNIVNLVGIGTTLLVHTQHSLFMFDRSNTLQTADKEVQLAMPDIFDVDYKEVFTSDLGICGLQDKYSAIADQFGYIFYDYDAHRLYKFGQGKIDNIDLDIIQFLNKYKPIGMRFAHDKEANRLLIKMYIPDWTNLLFEEKVISYNYVINKFISFHDYTFDYAFNTKNMLYLMIGRGYEFIIEDTDILYDSGIATDVYILNNQPNYRYFFNSSRNIEYNKFENIRNQEINQVRPSQIDIICNPNYDVIKYLEYITYKLYKIDKDEKTYVPSPVEEIKHPFSGNTLRVFNNEVDTDILDILINNSSDTTKLNKSIMNYKKPWWELGNWNFNYLRDAKQGNVSFPTRLYGNYFVMSFVFQDSYRRIEFESLDYQVTKDKP